MSGTDTALRAFQGDNTNLSTDRNFGTLKFPSANHEEETGGLGITFTEYKYSRPNIDGGYKPIKTGTQISLPLPKALSASYNARWENAEMGAFGQYLSSETPKAIKAGEQWAKNMFADPIKTTSETINSLIDTKRWASIGSGFGSAIGTDILTSNAIFRNATTSVGVARNPFLAAQFEGVNFRAFPFEYELIPRSKKDSEVIEKIVNAFKYGMHPSYIEFGTLKNALFRYPNIYRPRFTKDKWLFDIGMCVITDFSVDYHGHGSGVYTDDNGDKIPMNIRIKFTMQEIEIVTKETLDNNNKGFEQTRSR